MTAPSQRDGVPSAPGLALLTTLVQTAGTAALAPDGPASVGWVGYLLLVLSGFALADRHRFPIRNFAIVAALTAAYQLLDRPAGPTFLALLVGAAAMVTAGHRRWLYPPAAAGFAVWAVLQRDAPERVLVAGGAALVAVLAAELGARAGRLIRQRSDQQARLNEERGRRRASEERLRIAAELHDVLGHHLSLINVRAGVGLHLFDREPDQARSALDTIQQTSAEALQEVQSVINTLYPAGRSAPRAPAPGLDRLTQLTTDAGLPVRLEVRGGPRALPPGIDRAAYRVVQESLTNVRRHAGRGASATVTIEYRPAELAVDVLDDGGGRAPAQAVPGNGITGMQERAAALGGWLTAGPAPGGGWQVRAGLPLATGARP